MKKLVIIVLAAVALAGAGVGIYYAVRNQPKPVVNVPVVGDLGKREVQPVPTVAFTEIAEKAGIKFRYVNGATGKKLLPETMGGGVAFLDYDNDGKQDLLFVNSRPWPGDEAGPLPTMALYRNKGDGTFEDKTAAMGLNVPLYGQGVCVGDYDNDGWPDIFISAIGGNRLFHNEKGEKFTDATSSAGLGGGVLPALTREQFQKLDKFIPWPSSATFVDYDGDGKLDLFVCQYLSWTPAYDLGNGFQLTGGGRAYGRPQAFDGSQCLLFRNVDGKRFEDVSAQAGIQVIEPEGIGPDARKRNASKSLGVIICDPDEDGWPDIVVANDTVRNFFFHNVEGPNGTRKFEEIGLTAGVALAEGSPRGGMGIDGAEVLPGMWAIVIANFANEPSTFLCQDVPKRLRFADLAMTVGLHGPTLSPLKFGTYFFDYDLDGRPDMLTNNGHLEPEIQKVQGGQRYEQAPQLFWNTGQREGCFEPVTAKDAGSDLFGPLVGRGSAFGDIDGDGDLDVVLTSNVGGPRLLRNDQKLGHHWVRLVLEGDGKRSNRSAIGAVVTLEAGGKVQRRMVAGGRGYLSQSELPLTFGLGKNATIDKITIRWPGANAGEPMVLTGVAVDKVYPVSQKPKQTN